MLVNIDQLTVHQAHEVIAANVEHVVASLVMLVNLHAAGLEQVRDVVLAEVGLRYLKTSASAESSSEVRDADDCVTEDAVVVTKHLRRDLAEFIDLAGANFCVVNVNTAAKEEFVHLLDLLAGAEDTFVPPEVLEVVSANPLTCALVFVSHGRLEAVPRGKVGL